MKKKFDDKLHEKYREAIKNFCVRKIQKKYDTWMFWRKRSRNNMSTGLLIKSALSMFCNFKKPRVILKNKRKLALYLPKFVRVYEVKLFFDKYISNNIAFINRFKRHSRNVQMNFKSFSKHWDKEVMTLMNYERLNSKKKKITDTSLIIRVSKHMERFNKDFRWRLFKTYYNARLIPFLQVRYYLKDLQKKRKAAEGKFNRSNSKYQLDIDGEEHIRSNVRSKHPKKTIYHSADTIKKTENLKNDFNLDKIMEFDKTLGVLKKQSLYVLYIEAVNRWQNGNYEKIQENIGKTENQAKLTKKEKKEVSKAILSMNYIKSFYTLDDVEKEQVDQKQSDTISGIKAQFSKAEKEKFIMEFPTEFIRALILTCIDFMQKNLLEWKTLEFDESLKSFLTKETLEYFGVNDESMIKSTKSIYNKDTFGEDITPKVGSIILSQSKAFTNDKTKKVAIGKKGSINKKDLANKKKMVSIEIGQSNILQTSMCDTEKNGQSCSNMIDDIIHSCKNIKLESIDDLDFDHECSISPKEK